MQYGLGRGAVDPALGHDYRGICPHIGRFVGDVGVHDDIGPPGVGILVN